MKNGFREYLSLCGSLFYWLFVAPFRGKGYRVGHVFAQLARLGVQAVAMVALLALSIGLVLAMQSAGQLAEFNAEYLVPGLVSSSLVRELAPLVVAIVVIGRSGSAITAELGTMKVSEEIDALEIMAIPPVSYLALPRFIAMVFMMPVLTVLGIYAGLFGGWLICYYSLDMDTSYFVRQALDYVDAADVGIGLLKSVVFGFLIVTVACHIGLNVRGGAEGVGSATTRSVVISLFVVFIANALITALFFF